MTTNYLKLMGASGRDEFHFFTEHDRESVDKAFAGAVWRELSQMPEHFRVVGTVHHGDALRAAIRRREQGQSVGSVGLAN